MIKQTQIRSFISLINKITIKEKEKQKKINFQHTSLQSQDIRNTKAKINDELLTIKDKKMQKGSTKYRKSQNLYRQSNSEHFIQKFNSLRKYSKKKNAYEIYRQSLQKRKQHENSLISKSQSNDNCQLSVFQQRQHKDLKNIILPFGYSKNYKNTKVRDKLLKSKIISNPIFTIDSQNYCFKKQSNQYLFQIIQKKQGISQQIQKMHSQKLNYKPLFRVKKIFPQNIQILQICNQKLSLQSQQPSNQINRRKLKTVQTQTLQQKQLIRLQISKKNKYLKSQKQINYTQQLEGWQDDNNQDISDNF